MPDFDRHERRRAFFGRRKGHALKRTQSTLLETLLPQLAIDLTAIAPKNLTTLFPAAKPAQVWLEIGFGGGEHLVARARTNPDVGFIGVEPFVNGMAKALVAIDAYKLTNVRVHFGDALELLDWLPDHSLAGVDLLYPDPWPKKRHWKRRFVQDDTVAAIARVLRPGGYFRFASDIADYVVWTLQHLLCTKDFSWTAERADDWRLPWEGWVETRYEAKAKREGRTPAYLTFQRIKK
ncbi:MAG TPA: tRNA (guanosine(46)-N7)-methyltransferase TrmB [Xanthobacteraceae bacterium]|jgi:tRNA (guanine-N7-)-methyltransferase|nr:tRNA (guanosine(46)-N7)-methyltransferase TrmB [Xanthobacteraceae bacterium]